ncbi:MAG TPA: hypothetical protein V6C78_12795 [Crinalium sp.]|jgi:hypothetical protein
MQIGRFFSLGQGRVGQYLSTRVLVVRTPFQPIFLERDSREFCCFGFDTLKQAQKFMQSLSSVGLSFQLRKSLMLKGFPYEIVVRGQTDLARTLAFWDRRDQHLGQEVDQAIKRRSPHRETRPQTEPAIAA